MCVAINSYPAGFRSGYKLAPSSKLATNNPLTHRVGGHSADDRYFGVQYGQKVAKIHVLHAKLVTLPPA